MDCIAQKCDRTQEPRDEEVGSTERINVNIQALPKRSWSSMGRALEILSLLDCSRIKWQVHEFVVC